MWLFLYQFQWLNDVVNPKKPQLFTIDPAIPKKIWHKVGPKGLNNQTREWTDSCANGNPGYRVEFLTDLSGDEYVIKTFASRPDIVDSYLGLTIQILKADLLRYLLLFAEGGVWLDLDISCEDTPIDEWVPPEYESIASLVVGWKFDESWGDGFIHQFTTWTIMATPGLPHILVVIEDILQGLQDMTAEYNVPLAGLTLSLIGDVVDFTGPRRFTRSVFKSLGKALDGTIDLAGISNLREPKLLGDILILPGYVFAASSNTYQDQEGIGQPLVTHHYAGTWRNEYGGELA